MVDGLVDVVVASVVVVLVCANANGATSPQTKAMIVFFTLMPSFLIRFTSTVRDSRLGRTLLVRFISSPVGTNVIRRISDFGDLSGRREFSNIERQ